MDEKRTASWNDLWLPVREWHSSTVRELFLAYESSGNPEIPRRIATQDRRTTRRAHIFVRGMDKVVSGSDAARRRNLTSRREETNESLMSATPRIEPQGAGAATRGDEQKN